MDTVLFLLTLGLIQSIAGSRVPRLQCGEFGFRCHGAGKLRLCADGAAYGPSFLCPAGTVCNEASSDVCQTAFDYVERPAQDSLARCHRYERIADTAVPNCKGYILCIPNRNRFQGVKFKCTGRTVFNGRTRSCSSPAKYKCPAAANTTVEDSENIGGSTRQGVQNRHSNARPIDCKNYKFSVRNENSPAGKVAFFCPARPLPGESSARCTVFSSQFCITLHKEEEEDQFSPEGTRRRPRY